MACNITLYLSRTTTNVIINHVQRRFMPVNVPPTATGKRRFRLAVETDPHKLVNYCCGLNYHIDEPPIKLKPDNEYPDWLWTLRLEAKKPSWELKPGTEEYYLTLKEEEQQRNYIQRMTAGHKKKIVAQDLKDSEEYKKFKRFAALAHMEDDAGFNSNELENWTWIPNQRLEVVKRGYYLPQIEGKVMYMDKVAGNTSVKNFCRHEDSSFQRGSMRVSRLPGNTLKAFQDSKRRHRYAGT